LAGRQKDNKEDLNTKIGNFGYLGRLPASNFKGVIFDEQAFEEWYVSELIGDSSSFESSSVTSVDGWTTMSVQGFLKKMKDIEEELNSQNDDE